MTLSGVVIEQLALVAPFGMGFWDTGRDRLESEGLRVRLFRLGGDDPLDWVSAVANRRGIFAAHDVPGLREFEARAGETDIWLVLSPQQPYLVELLDPWGRYSPFVLRVDLPAPPGLVIPPCISDLALPEPVLFSPPKTPVYVPLFSQPSRLVPAGKTAVRATLLEAGRGPAAFAVLEISQSGRLLGRGIADENGQVMAVVPYPEPSSVSPPASPPGPPAKPHPLADQTWSVDISVRYRPGLKRWELPWSDSAPTRRGRMGPSLVELCDVARQPPAAAVATADSPSLQVVSETLRYGEELLLAADSGGTLFITPA